MPCCRLANLKVSQFQGYGLSFTTFSYSGLHLSSSKADGAASGHNVTVTVQVANTGDRDGKEVVQVYSTPPSGAAFPAGAPKQNLVAFQVVAVPHGGSKTVRIDVDPAQWETAMADGTRAVVPGQYTVAVGGHQPKDSEGSAGTSGAVVTAQLHL